MALKASWVNFPATALSRKIYQSKYIIQSVKSLNFVGASLKDLAAFPEEARQAAGFELWQVQLGAMPSDFKPMPTVGAGAYEIRIKVQG